MVTPFGAAREIVDEGVTGFVRSTVAGLAAAIRDSSTLDRGACRAAVADRFSAERFVSEHVACYERALSGREAGTSICLSEETAARLAAHSSFSSLTRI